MKRILITGTTGYIASSLAAYLRRRPEKYSVETVSLREEGWRQRSFAGFDALVHTAGLAHVRATAENKEDYYRINRDLAAAAAEKAKADGVKQFVFLSSMSVYGLEEGSITADTMPNPNTDYGKSKLEAEEILRTMECEEFRVALLRPPMVYGPGCPGNYGTLAKLALKLPVFPVLQNRRSMVYIDTLCAHICRVIDETVSGVVFPQDGAHICTADLAELIAAAHGKRLPLTGVLTPAAALASRCVSKAKKAFGSLTYGSSMTPVIPEPPLWERVFRTEGLCGDQTEPLISVVMPAYNAERYLEDAVNSVLRQTYRNFELIVVNDCSRDGTWELLQKLAATDERIVALTNEKNSGASVTRNRAIAAAKGDWIAFLDSDDMWREDKLAQQVRLLELCPEARLLYTASAFMNEAGERFAHVMRAKPLTTRRMLLKGNIISCSSVLASKEDLLKYPMAGDKMHEDYVTWLRILQDTPVAYGIDEPLLIYRLSATSKSANRIASAKMLYRSYRHVGYGALHSGAMVFRYTFYSIRKRGKIFRS